MINKTIASDKIEENNDSLNSHIIDKKLAYNDQNNTFDIEDGIDIALIESTTYSAPMIKNNPQNTLHKFPGLSLSIANNTNIDNPYLREEGNFNRNLNPNNIGEENPQPQRTLSGDNNQTNSRNKLAKPLIPSLRLGNKGNNIGKSNNGNQEEMLKINFDLQHKEFNEQRNIAAVAAGK